MTRIVRTPTYVSQPNVARPYAKGLASGILLMGLIGCLPDAPKAPMTAMAEPRDVRISLPSKPTTGRTPGATTPAATPLPSNRDLEREESEAAAGDLSSRRATMEDLGAWMADGAAEAPAKLREMNEKARRANEALARREATAAEPEAAPKAPPQSKPDPKPESKPLTPPAAKSLPPAAPKPETLVDRTPPKSQPAPSRANEPVAADPPVDSTTPEIASAASALAKAMGEALAKNASEDDLQRPITKAISDAIAALSEPTRRFDVADYPELDEDEAAFVTRLHEASAEVGRDLSAGKPLGEAVAKLAEAIKAVEPAKPLLVKRSEFATRVDGFGQLQPISNRRFLPGRQNQVILYNELDGFTSERNEKNEWVTTLATKIQILAKHDGTEVWNRNWLAVTDTSSVRRGDFFVCEKVVLSEYLTIGTYILKTSVRDERTGAIAEKSVEFSMVADPALASR